MDCAEHEVVWKSEEEGEDEAGGGEGERGTEEPDQEEGGGNDTAPVPELVEWADN